MSTLRLPQLIGTNTARLRGDAKATQQQLADAVTKVGLPWTRFHVSRWERGAVEAGATLPQLVVVAAALDTLPGRVAAVTVADLLEPIDENDDRHVLLVDHLAVPPAQLAAVLRGSPAGVLSAHSHDVVHEVVEDDDLGLPAGRAGYRAVDRRVARSLGLSDSEMIALSHRVWGVYLDQERQDRIQRSDAQTREERAAVTAMLRDELRDKLRNEAMIDAAVRAAELREEMEL